LQNTSRGISACTRSETPTRSDRRQPHHGSADRSPSPCAPGIPTPSTFFSVVTTSQAMTPTSTGLTTLAHLSRCHSQRMATGPISRSACWIGAYSVILFASPTHSATIDTTNLTQRWKKESRLSSAALTRWRSVSSSVQGNIKSKWSTRTVCERSKSNSYSSPSSVLYERRTYCNTTLALSLVMAAVCTRRVLLMSQDFQDNDNLRINSDIPLSGLSFTQLQPALSCQHLLDEPTISTVECLVVVVMSSSVRWRGEG